MFAVFTVAVAALFTACGTGSGTPTNTPIKPTKPTKPTGPMVNYAEQLTLDLTSSTKKQEVTVRQYIDGDTTHFNPVYSSTIASCPSSDFADTDGYIKARYIAINTPESTGKIEPWGSKASKYTHGKLADAESIIVESDDGKWNIDSSGSMRYVVWVWYKPKGETEYHNLNLEILQSGLAWGSSVANNRYGTVCNNAMAQARAYELYVFSKELDPDFPYGAAVPVTLKEIRVNIEDYNGKKIRVEGVVAAEFNNSVYIEDYDADTDTYFGMPVYYGYQTGPIREVLRPGNKVSVVGVITAFSGTYQISGVSHDEYNPESANNTNIIETDQTPGFAEISAADFVDGTLKVSYEEEVKDENGDVVDVETKEKEIAFAEAVLSTSVSLKNLTVTKVYTTTNETSASKGAMTITCKSADGKTIDIRTEVLYDADGKLVTADKYPAGTVINVKGIVEYYIPLNATEGQYQIKTYRYDFIEIVE